MLAAFDLVAQAMQPRGDFGAVHAGCILLGLEQAALLERACLAVLAFGDIEDFGVSMELRCGHSHLPDGQCHGQKWAAMNWPVVSGAWTLPIRACV